MLKEALEIKSVSQSIESAYQKTKPETNKSRKITWLSKPDSLQAAVTKQDKSQIRKFGKVEYAKHYPENKSNFRTDKYDDSSCVLYSENQQGELISTGRILFDGEYGLPITSIVPKWIEKRRLEGKSLIEVGEFVITDEARGQLKDYYRAFFEIAQENDVDYMIIIVKHKDVSFHTDVIGATVIVDDIQNNYGSEYDFACLEWPIKTTKRQFKRWAGVRMISSVQRQFNDQPDAANEDTGLYERVVWDQYSRLHASVMTSVQLSLFKEACSYLSGDVVDCGCGTAKLAPFLADDLRVSSYTGLDYSEKMVTVARDIVRQVAGSRFSIQHTKIENAKGQYTSAVSIHSYYSWPKPEETLVRIYDLLTPGAIFILATPNEYMSQKKLFHEARKELIAHPDFAAFETYNMELEANSQANFISMHSLIDQVQRVGFNVTSCHQDHYDGGVNFIVMRKPC